MEGLKGKALFIGVVAGITVVLLQTLVGPFLDLMFGMALIAIFVAVAKFAGAGKPKQ